MAERKFAVGDQVVFEDEHRRRQVGTVNSLDPFELSRFGDGPFVGIVTEESYGCWVRKEAEVESLGEEEVRNDHSLQV